jgi:hypothetical protein
MACLHFSNMPVVQSVEGDMVSSMNCHRIQKVIGFTPWCSDRGDTRDFTPRDITRKDSKLWIAFCVNNNLLISVLFLISFFIAGPNKLEIHFHPPQNKKMSQYWPDDANPS